MHSAETRPYTFNPATSNMDELIKAKNMTKNLVWKDIYDSLLNCRRNIIFHHPNVFLSIPINGEQIITKNFSPVNQPWCTHMIIKNILMHRGDWKEVKDYNTIQKPAFFELSALKRLLVITSRSINTNAVIIIWNVLGGLSPT